MRAALVWGLAAAFYFYELMLLVSPSVMVNDLTHSFSANAEQIGSLAAYYYYAYAFMQIPVGLLMDRFGPRILLTLAALICAIGCLIFGKAPILEIAKLGRFVMGMGGAFAVVGCLKLASKWYPSKRFAFLTGIMVAVGMMGGVFGQAPVALVVDSTGWRDAVFIAGGVGIILSIAMWFIIADSPLPTFIPKRHIYLVSPQLSMIQSLYEVMKIPQVWIVSIFAGLMFVPTTSFGQLWGVPYFSERFGIEKHAAALMVSMIFLGWAVGGPLYGWLSDKICRRRLPMAFAAFTTLIVISTILFVSVSPFQMKILMFLLGVFSSGFILAFSLVREINTPILTGTAIGFINTINNASGALAQPIVGKLLDMQWDGTLLPNGNPLYSLAMYHEALLFLPLCIVIALMMIPFIKETFCQGRYHE